VSKVLAEQTISPDAAATVETEAGQITIRFPAGSVAGDAVVTISQEPQVDVTAPPFGFKAGATCFSIELTTDLAPGAVVEITVKYSDADIASAGEYSTLLSLSRYDENTAEWVVLPTTVDTTAQTLTATTSKFSKWMVMVSESEPESETSFPILLVAIVGGLLILIIISIVLILARRRSARG
jgi:hypothetical protein